MKRLALAAALLLTAAPAFISPALAATENYTLDKPHTQIIFDIGHMGYSHSYGKFLDYKGEVNFDPLAPESSNVNVTINTASLDMGDDTWKEHTLKFFKPDQFPTMTFKSTSIHKTGDKTADITGDLTLLGVTKPVVLHTTFNGAQKNPFGKYVAGFSATGDIKRSDFGMKDYLPMVGDDVHLTIEVEADKVDPNQPTGIR